eukprot:CAMPEP_0172666712 /NCGR_PEP_ID=MMETSP1074-20121228/7978_1 /TAXON_ID=2916 /ORGANISM="Ceratium fusus, Strain PA161109" /LENGTH=131 /DNA_ID=CAMNT_0013483131 /DNA_START=52 /DNA_END=447 /DNA_ORIENTATION=-
MLPTLTAWGPLMLGVLLHDLATTSVAAVGEDNITTVPTTNETLPGDSPLAVARPALMGVGSVGLVVLLFLSIRWLTSPNKTPPPLLADSELCEGDPVHGVSGASDPSLWMGGPGRAREMTSHPPAEGFTQF